MNTEEHCKVELRALIAFSTHVGAALAELDNAGKTEAANRLRDGFGDFLDALPDNTNWAAPVRRERG